METKPWYQDHLGLLALLGFSCAAGTYVYSIIQMFLSSNTTQAILLLSIFLLFGFIIINSILIVNKNRIKSLIVQKLEVSTDGVIFYLRIRSALVPLDYFPADFIRLKASFKPQNAWVRFYTKSGAVYSFSPRDWESEHLKQDLKRLGLYR